MERRRWGLVNGKNNIFWFGNSYFCLCPVSRWHCNYERISAKEANRVEKEESESQTNLETTGQSINLSEELSKLNDLKEKGIISQEDFEKAKNKLLNN